MFKIDDTRATSVNAIWVSFDWPWKLRILKFKKINLLKIKKGPVQNESM